MLKWFREYAPIKLKLSCAFGAQAVLVASCGGASLLAMTNNISPQLSVEISSAALVVSVVLGVVLRRTIYHPYVTTVVRMEGLMAGDVAAPVLFSSYRDCVGRMAKAMQKFREAGFARAEEDAKVNAQFAANEAERVRAEAERAEAGKQLSRIVEALAKGLERLSNGDLLYRVDEAFPSAYEKLRGDFNDAMDKLQDAISSIATNTQGVRAGAGEITQASDDLSRRTEQQAASLEQTAAALDEITATVRKSAESASEARNVVTTAKADAESSGEVVRETVNAMSGIESSSKKIGNIIGVIDEIAFQTNLLALNAGVEAARAGDAGRGFAVVATEVRALAQRSADAAKEIKTLISASGAQVATGVKLVGDTGKALGRIVEQVNRLNVLVGDIAGSSQEQATGLAEVNTAVNQMDQVVQQNAAMVEQTTAASHSLASEAEALGRLVGQFQIGADSHQQEPMRVTAPPLRKASALGKVSRAPLLAPSGKFVAVPKPTPVGVASSEDWDEF
jgi:methyl-accepting chemotaxis protein